MRNILSDSTYITDAIISRVNIADAARFYGATFNRAGFAVCPFHSEKTASFSIKGNYGHCFGCGWNGDVISFVKSMFGLNYAGAITKLNNDFSLGLPIGRKPTLREQRDAAATARQIAQEREKAEAVKRERQERYWAVWDEWIRLDRNSRDYAPASPNDEWHPLFVEALQKLAYQQQLINELPL